MENPMEQQGLAGNIIVVTGAGSGMGKAVAKRLVQKGAVCVAADLNENGLISLQEEMHEYCNQIKTLRVDVTSKEDVERLVQLAVAQGPVKAVVHAAGVSPHMGNSEKIFQINAVGTVNIDTAFSQVMGAGGCILNVASMSSHMLPDDKKPRQIYALALRDMASFEASANQMFDALPEEQRSGAAYSISKNFVAWYTAKMALRLGGKGIRVVSISPGTVRTPMGELEGEDASSFAKNGALGRVGEPEELARMMTFMISDDCSYLTGVDILYDGGSIAAFRDKVEQQAMIVSAT